MTTQFITEYLDKKIEENENIIICTFFDLRVVNNVKEDEVDYFFEKAKIRLENMNYQVYFTGAEYIYNNIRKTVADNEYMVAIKEQGDV